MADRRVKVVFEASILGYKRAMEEAATATEKTKKSAEEAGKTSDESNKKSSESAKQTAEEITKLAATHQEAAKASGLQYAATGQLVDMNGKALSSQQAAAHGLESFSAETYLAAKALDEAAASTEVADTKLQELIASATGNSDAWETAGEAMVAFGGASVAGLGLAGKAAMDWETAWAGVTKTVDGTPEQMDELEGSLRDLAKILPSTHEEIAAVAEAAGQLGVKREDVAGFTKVMIDLGETTNLTADEAATSIAQISNVMGTMERDGSKGVERFSATLVALGNAGASTEAEILEMAKRIAGAAKLVGASESDVLALANAMASVGIEAQLGGGVMSRVMQRMYGDVKKGGEGLDNLAKVAGVSSKDFATAFETDPVRAVDTMVKGLGRIKDEGGDVIDTMSDLGIKGTEETGVILRLAGAGDLLSDSLKLGDSAWQSNSALAAEAAKRYETTESKVKIAWNNIKDAAIDAGAVLLPIISGIADGAAGVAQAYGALPVPVQGAITALGGVVGVAALGAGAFLSLTPRILDTMTAFNKLAPAGSTARGVIGGVGKALGIAAVAYIAFAAANALATDAASKDRTKTTIEDFNNALLGTAQNGAAAEKALDGAFKGVLKVDQASGGTTNVNTFADALDRVLHASWQDSAVDFKDTVFGANATSGINLAKDAIGNYDKALASMATSGNFKDAAAGFQLAAKKAKDNGDSVEDLVKLFPAYKEAILANKSANGETQVSQEALTDAMLKGGDASKGAATSVEGVGKAASGAAPLTEEMAKALEDVGVRADGTIGDLDKFTEALMRAGLLQLSARDAARGFEDAIDAVAESVKTNGTDLDIHTEKGRANQAALDAVAAAGYRVIESNAKNGEGQEVLQGNLNDTYNALIASAGEFGITGDAAIDLAREIMNIPPGVTVESWMSDKAKKMAEDTKAAAEAVDGKTVNVYVNTHETTLQKVIRQFSDEPNAAPVGAGTVLAPAKATGGRILGYSGGGKLPSDGPGTQMTDGFLAVDALGIPRARVDKDEWIINGPSSNRYNRELAAINAGTFPKLPGYTAGGRAGREYSAQSLGYSPSGRASSMTVAAPAVTVMIGNEQLDSRMYRVAGSAISSADSQSQFSRRGR